MKTQVAVYFFLLFFPMENNKGQLWHGTAMQPGDGFAVVELFTSEGCSSCPPADESVAGIKSEYPDNAFVLTFHVDYWDYLGWKDEFSDAVYSRRQRQYGRVFNLNNVYTPQVVINGRKEFVGSDKDLLEKTIKDEIKNTKNVLFAIQAESRDENSVLVSYLATTSSTTILNIALIQQGAESNVKRGENGGLKLKHINIVRKFKVVSLAKNDPGSLTFKMPAGLVKEDCMVLAYLQDKNNLQISGVARTVIK